MSETFKTIFSDIITHINAVCFVVKSTDEKLDVNVKYIFSCVTSLFSQDISENFIIVATHANKEIMEKGPKIISAILEYEVFAKIIKKMNNGKWYYSFDSYSIFDSEKDYLAKLSFKTLNELYKEKIQKLPQKSIKNCSEVLKYRIDLKIEINILIEKGKELLIEKGNLENEQESNRKKKFEILEIEKEINNLEKSKKDDLDKMIKAIKRLDDNKIIIKKIVKVCVYDEENRIHTHCPICKRNCHSPCNCWFQNLSRCKIYPFWSFAKKCEECGHEKKHHCQDKFRYIIKEIDKDINSQKDIEDEEIDKDKFIEEQIAIEKSLLNLDIKSKNNNDTNDKIGDLYIQKLELNKNFNNKKEKYIKNKIHKLNEDIIKTIYNLKQKSDKLNALALNNNYFKDVDQYIDSLKDKLIILGNEEKQLEELGKMKINYALFESAVTMKLNENEKNNLDESQLVKILNGIPFE